MQDQIDPAISPIYHPTLFQSFFQGGFASSTEVRGDGRRLDLIQSSGHEMLAAKDYAQLAEQNITTVRDGLRWHQIVGAGRVRLVRFSAYAACRPNPENAGHLGSLPLWLAGSS